MGELVLNSEVKLPMGPEEICSLFGQGDASLGWLFGSEAASLSPGALVRLSVPLVGSESSDGTARILSYTPSRRIVLAHEAPWAGQVECRLTPVGVNQTRLRLRVGIEDKEMARLGSQLGLFSLSSDPNDGAISVGLLTGLSGASGILGRSTVNCAELAVAELNVDGGVLGRPVRLVVADDATSPPIGVIGMQRLLSVPNLSVVVGMHSSATFSRTSPLAVKAGVPYFYTPTSEPFADHPLLVRFGETPIDQLHRALPRIAEETGGSRWFLAGNEYSWPRAIAETASAIVERMGGQIVGEGFLPIGSREFESILGDIRGSGADHVISSFIGNDHVRFERDFFDSGLRDSVATFAPLMDDAVVEHLGESARGIWNVLGYFEGLRTPENAEFLQRYRSRFGLHSGPVSAAAEGVYEAIHRWARACVSGRGSDPTAVLSGLKRVSYSGPRLAEGSSGRSRLLLGRATGARMQVVDELPGVARM